MTDDRAQDAGPPSEGSGEPAAGPEGSREIVAATRKQIRREQRRLLFRTPGFLVGMAIILFWVVSAIVPELITDTDPKEPVRDDSGSVIARESPGADAWFGTDNIGRDVFARVIHGARPILIVAPVSTLIAIAAGTLIGLLMGYFLGWVDEILSRIVESILSIPVILMAILVIFTFGKSTPVIIGTIALLFTAPIARTVRAATIAEAQLDYVTSAKMRGERSLFIISREILPNITGVIVVELTVRLGYAVFTLATLAFLGQIGRDITEPDWGIDVSQSWERIVGGVWWPTIFPALAIASLVIAANLVADSIDRATKS
ncbi:MAG: ABC transporter permease [Actinobacteria bacterium]|nr:ABC transporter permease [Actinomycetota bacterium]NIS34461.1 ABC transporter permease [Actinomycetota bacterium]NIT97503.1 ABC transporter permease [Actinomycetota bacterium]NIU21172.1 ABC transporter permease [Actinomycetota bacterium]NIU69229.1 ABC transporter permease [Actinomycetota bacterium]